MNKFIRFLFVILVSISYQATYAQNNFYWKSISAAEDYTVAVRYDGTLWAWGRNNYGQLGNSTTTNSDIPLQIGTANNWKQASAKGGHVVAINADAYLYAWGKNDNGELGDGTTNEYHVPTQIGTLKWNAAYAGDGFTIGIILSSANNSVWGWGKNDKGQLGVSPSTLSGSLSPVQVPVPKGAIVYPTWQSISVGKNHVIAIGTDVSTTPAPGGNDVWVWGDNSSGQLGLGTTTATEVVQKLSVDKTFVVVSTKDKHTLALKTDGSLWAWGTNTNGVLAADPNITTAYLVPTQIQAANTYTSIAAGLNFSAALKTDGTLWSWGENNNGQLANNTIATATWQPVQESTNSTDWDRLTTGDYFAFSIKDKGQIQGWGDNTYGQLGIGNQTQQDQPVLLPFSQFTPYYEKVSGTTFPGISKGVAAWADFDGDGYIDVLISASAKEDGTTANRTQLWKNNGNNTFTKVTSTNFAEMGYTDVILGDYNNDGFIDVLITGTTTVSRRDATTKLYKNNGDGTFTEQTEPVPNPTSADLTDYGKNFPGIYNNTLKPAVAWADYNNDGFIDLIFSGYTQKATTYKNKMYRNNGDGTFTEVFSEIFQVNPNQSASNSTVSWVDYNGDGYKDLVIETGVTGTSYTRLYKNNAGQGFTQVSASDAPFVDVARSGITWGDYNNDGYPDVLVAGGIGGSSGGEYTELYKNNGNGTFTKLLNTGLKGVTKASVVMVDIDGDGLQDIIAGGNVNMALSQNLMDTYVFKNNGNDTFTEIATPLNKVIDAAISYADINNDGKPDLMVGGKDNTGGTTELYLNVSLGAVTLPSQPQNLSAQISNGNIQLNWEAPATISGFARYNVRLGTSSGANDIISGLNNQQFIFPNGTLPSHLSNIAIDPTKNYYYSVQAIDAAGNKSPWSTEYTFTQQTLPVTLQDFAVAKQNNRVKLSWTTILERNNNRFEIERISPEGNTQIISRVASKGNSDEKVSYTVYDNSPYIGINYYRLKQYDNDGEVTDFGVKSITFTLDQKSDISIYPNPSNGTSINLSLTNFGEQQMFLELIDLQGRVLQKQTLKKIDGDRQEVFFNKSLSSGIYVLQIKGDGVQASTKLIVK